jgi:proline iminopeptidase
MRFQVSETSLYVDVEGAQLRERSGGWTEAPVVLALHGGPGFDQGYLRPGLQPLSAHAQVVYVDLRGQGRSGRPPLDTCTLEQMADDVAELCDLLGLAAPVVFGHSAGGFVALTLAARHPELVGGLALCSTAPTLAPMDDGLPTPRLDQRAGADAVELATRLFGGDFGEETLEAFGRKVAPYYAAPGHQDLPGRLLALSTFEPLLAEHFFTELAPSYDVRPSLADIEVPTEVVVGAWDWVCPPIGSRVIAESIPGAELTMVEDAGHFVFSESPAAFLDVMCRLISRCSPT